MKRFVLWVAIMLQAVLSFGQNYRNSSEVFIEVTDRGNYTIQLDNDFMGTSKNRFRFYEVGTYPIIVIKRDTTEVFRKRIRVQPETRLIATFSKRSGWQTVSLLPIFEGNQYALDDWSGSTNTSRPIYLDGLMTAKEFSELNTMIKDEQFSDRKIKLIKTALNGALITTIQLAELIKHFDFDDKKLEIAKFAYDSLADRKNFFKLTTSFTFQSSKDEILAIANKH